MSVKKNDTTAENEIIDITKATNIEGKYLMYRGKPLVREGNMICYGYLSDPYYLLLTVMSNKDVGEREVPDKVLVQIMNSDSSLPDHKRIAKQDIKNGLGEALDIGIVWLERYIA